MAIFKEFSSQDIKTSKSYLNQLVDILQEDISGSITRKKLLVYVTGGVGPGVTSSLFQTVYDQDFTLQTANPVLDMAVGICSASSVVQTSGFTTDANGKYIFPSQTLMLREKMDIYRNFAQTLLGNANNVFTTVSASTTFQINEALFLAYKRLFARDQIKRETFAIKMYVSGFDPWNSGSSIVANLTQPAQSASIFTDISSSTNKAFGYGGQVSTIVNSANTNIPVGLLFNDKGVAVFDISKIFHPATGSAQIDMRLTLTGTISAVNSLGTVAFTGSMNQFLASASVDNIIDHFATTRFSGSAQTANTFQNITNINSTIFFCNLSADEFNYSSNPSYIDSNNRVVVIDQGQEDTQQSFSYITGIGLYSANNELLGFAKLSRPVLKDGDRSLTLKVRIDY